MGVHAPLESTMGPDDLTFTPRFVNPNKCQARIWGGGVGGQCSKDKHDATDFCVIHCDKKWQVHGRVDGPIPLAKLAEFLLRSKTFVRTEASTKPWSCCGVKRDAPEQE